MQLFVGGSFLFPVITIPIIIWDGLDPYHHIFLEFFQDYYSYTFNRFILVIVRFVLLFVICIEAERMLISGFVIFVLKGLNQFNSCLDVVDKYSMSLFLKQPINLDCIRFYQRIWILQQILYQGMTNLSTIILLMIFGSSLGLSFVTVRMFRIIPMPFYLFCPMGLLVCLYFTKLGFKAADYNENCKTMLQKWKLKRDVSSKSKIVHKYLKSLKQLGFYIAFYDYPFFMFTKDSKCTYVDTLLTYTTHMLLTIPERFLNFGYVFANLRHLVSPFLNLL